VRERLTQHLGERGEYLWVLDNLPELSPLDVRTRILQFLRAPNSRGHTLLTTRDSRPAQGDLTAARALHERVLQIRRRVLGDDHRVTLTSMNNLASTLCAQGDFGAARALQEQMLPICQRVLGEEHPYTSISAWTLFTILFELGDEDGARQLLQSSLSWLLERDELSLAADQRMIRGYVSIIYQRANE
jgi:hypothetical protein